ncbi:TetR family transcriptional regulator C-terminal domain-containing protein [Halomonas sp. Bachu 37]|uniref:TetR/AcrR family transcriptional regulator n=1 Tax=Halomonas kashgarensis TaxID=3084920 RepID=UPI00321718A7
MKTTATRDRLLDTGAELIGNHGYNATGINAVLKASGVPKGSFYHYFASKEDFGLAVIDRVALSYDEKLTHLLEDTRVAPLDRLRGYFAAGREDMLTCDHTHGCLIGNLGQEMAGQSDVFRDRLDKVFQQWEQHFVRCLTDAQRQSHVDSTLDIEALASFILAGWEGAILRAKTLKSVEPMQRFENILFSRLLVP